MPRRFDKRTSSTLIKDDEFGSRVADYADHGVKRNMVHRATQSHNIEIVKPLNNVFVTPRNPGSY